MKTILLFLGALACMSAAAATETWTDALQKMTLSPNGPLLNRDNIIPQMLGAFSSNATAKALIFLPAVGDDFYLLGRNEPKLDIAARNLLEAITALTNATRVRVTFRAPFILLHMERDFTDPACVIHDAVTGTRLKQNRHLPRVHYFDTHWERLQPVIQKAIGIEIRPAPQSEDAWHFSRHHFAGWDLSDWELLNAISLSGRTVCTVQNNRILFGERH